jgi:hypothetical protein
MTKKITIVTNEDDWEGLYIDGKIVVQDHKLSVYDVLLALDIIPEDITCDHDWLLRIGYLPNDLKDVVVRDE